MLNGINNFFLLIDGKREKETKDGHQHKAEKEYSGDYFH